MGVWVSRRVVVIGGGIVGVAVAAALAEGEDVAVTVLERGPRGRLPGSTGHAPGFVGLLGEASVATELARASAACYEELEHEGVAGFDRCGGLEVATTDEAMADLRRRAGLAEKRGLPARVLDSAQAADCAPQMVDPRACVGGVLYPDDGTARAGTITAALTQRATRAGAQFVRDTAVTAIDLHGDRVRAVRCHNDQTYVADDVVLACGIWGPTVAAMAGQVLPLTPVAHPYVYGPLHGRSHRCSGPVGSPFVRWPEHHVYARDHGDRFGLGTYDHLPQPVAVEQLGDNAERPWPPAVFDPAVARALALLPAGQRFTPEQLLNGVFSMTADNLPLLGPSATVDGLWITEALWVTHAAGAAHALAQLMTDASPTVDGLDALRPDRFADQPADELTDRALRLYRDIYTTT